MKRVKCVVYNILGALFCLLLCLPFLSTTLSLLIRSVQTINIPEEAVIKASTTFVLICIVIPDVS